MNPHAEPMRLPAGYQTDHRVLDWAPVRRRLEEAEHYWLAVTRDDGRPHVVPVDGLWLDDRWYFGGDPDTVHQRVLRENPDVAVHLDDPMAAVIVEGTAVWVRPTVSDAERLAAASRAQYGWAPPAASYQAGIWMVVPRRVLAWTSVAEDATRFTFDETTRWAFSERLLPGGDRA